MSEDFTCIQREGNFLEVVPHGFSKATGIRFLMEKYDIPLERIYAFGDSNNDLDMLRYVQNSIAMGVCTEEVAEAASYRTDTVEQDGIEKAMRHFGMIE
jgi:hydroxymethylpyrimidine pyrophosphatase-like HAD family hydrolase